MKPRRLVPVNLRTIVFPKPLDLGPGTYAHWLGARLCADCPPSRTGAAMWAFKGDVYLWSGLVETPKSHFDGADLWVWTKGAWDSVSH